MTMITEWPRVTVIVLNYNGQQHLKTCFRSLYALDYPADRLELMLVDNASTDESLEFMRAHFPGVTLVCNDHNYGFSKGNNIGAQRATGEYVAFLNNDMRVDPAWLTELIRPIQRDPEVACTGSRIMTWDGQRIDFADAAMNFYGYGYQRGWGSRRLDDYQDDKPMIFVCGGAMLVHRGVFLEAGGFDEDFFAYYEDTDLGWRLWVLGYKVLLAPRSIAYHVHHGSWGQVADEKKRVLYERNALCAAIKNYENETLDRVLPIALLLLLRRAYLSAEVDLSRYRAESAAVAPGLYQEEEWAKGSRYTISYYGREAWRTLRTQGPLALGRKAFEEGRRRMGWPGTPTTTSRPPLDDPAYDVVPRQALSYLVAANDVARSLPRLLEKRAYIQAHRRRPDREIIPLFQLPLEVSYFDPRYLATQEKLVQAWGLDTLFGTEP